MKILGLGVPELVIILVVVLLIFGPKNLPKLGASLGKTVKSLREGMAFDKKDDEEVEEIIEIVEDEPEVAYATAGEPETKVVKKGRSQEGRVTSVNRPCALGCGVRFNPPSQEKRQLPDTASAASLRFTRCGSFRRMSPSVRTDALGCDRIHRCQCEREREVHGDDDAFAFAPSALRHPRFRLQPGLSLRHAVSGLL